MIDSFAKSAGAGGVVRARDARADLVTLARGGSLTVLGSCASAVLGLLLSLLVSRAYGAAGAGVFFVCVGLLAVLTAVSQLGAQHGVVLAIPRYRAQARHDLAWRVLPVAVVPVLAVGVVVSGMLVAAAPAISGVLVDGAGSGDVLPYLYVFAAVLPLAAASNVLLAVTRAVGTMTPFVVVENVAKPAARPALVLLALGAGLGSVGLALSWAVPIAIGFVAALFAAVALLRRGAPASGALDGGWTRVGVDFWRFSVLRGLAGVFDIAILWLDVILVGALASAAQAGIYAVASRMISAAALGLQSLVNAIGPQLSSLLAHGENERAGRVYQAATCWLTVLSFPLFLTLAVFAPFFLGLFGDDFVAGETALVILALVMLGNAAVGPIPVVQLMSGRSGLNLLSTAAAFAVFLGANLALIPRFGMTGAAVAWAASLVVLNGIPLAHVYRSLGIHPASRALFVAALGALACWGAIGVAVRASLGPTAVGFFSFAGLATVAYVAFLTRFREQLALPLLWAAVGRHSRDLSSVGAR